MAPIAPLVLKVVLPTVVEVPDTAKAANVTVLIVVAGTLGGLGEPKLKARSRVPAVLTSVSAEIVVGVPQVIVAAPADNGSSRVKDAATEKNINVVNAADVRGNRILLELWQSIFVFIGLSTLVLEIALSGVSAKVSPTDIPSSPAEDAVKRPDDVITVFLEKLRHAVEPNL